MIPSQLTATLPHPIGLNDTYKIGRGRFYMAAPARKWQQDAFILMRAAGWRPLPEGLYWLHLTATLFTVRHDIDSPVKTMLDVVASVLEVDDSSIGSLVVTKGAAMSKDDQRLDLLVKIYEVDDKADWASRSLAAIPNHAHRLLNPSIMEV